jgi:hypothetical protein
VSKHLIGQTNGPRRILGQLSAQASDTLLSDLFPARVSGANQRVNCCVHPFTSLSVRWWEAEASHIAAPACCRGQACHHGNAMSCKPGLPLVVRVLGACFHLVIFGEILPEQRLPGAEYGLATDLRVSCSGVRCWRKSGQARLGAADPPRLRPLRGWIS